MTPSQTPIQNADYRLEVIDDELLLFHPSQTKMMYCNQTASLVWQLCDGERSVQEIIGILRTAYPEASDLDQDVHKILEQFQAHGAISVK